MCKLFIFVFIFVSCSNDTRELYQIRSIQHPEKQQWIPMCNVEKDTILIQDQYGNSEYFEITDKHVGAYYMWTNFETNLSLYNPGFSRIGDTLYRIDGKAVGITINRW